MKLELFIPVSPLHYNQMFGENADYYAKFHDAFGNPLKGHNGIDLMAVHGQPVYAPIGGTATYTTDSHGGEGVIITTDQPYEYANGNCWFNIIHWHLIGDTDPKFPKPFKSKKVNTGDLIGYADNTGAPFESTGDHLHWGLIPVDQNQKVIFLGNGYAGAIDQLPYISKFYAQDAVKVKGIFNTLIFTLQSLLSKLQGGKIK